MPTGAFHSHYWADAGGGGTPTFSTGGYNYPYAFDGTFIGMSIVPVTFFLSRARLKQLYNLWITIKRRLPKRLIALGAVLKLIFSSDFSKALAAVQETAHNPSSRDIRNWGDMSRAQISLPNESENVFRHFNACLKLPSVDRSHQSVLVSIAWDTIRQTHGN